MMGGVSAEAGPSLVRENNEMKSLTTAVCSFCTVATMAGNAPRPNIVFCLLDDLGVRDLGCYGSTFHETPRIDRLAQEGMRFTNAYASHPVCGPSRTGIISGRFPARMGVTHVGGRVSAAGLPWPKALQNAGYATCFVGKWHMGGAQSILNSGFDINIAGNNNGQPSDYYYPYKFHKDGRSYGQDVPGMEDGKPGDYLTDKLTDKALGFIESNNARPFLLYFSYYQTHKPRVAPAQGKKEHVSYFKTKLDAMPDPEAPTTREVVHGASRTTECLVQRNPEFAGQIKAVDDSVGRLLDKLDELGIAENTIVIFTSDQGSVCSRKDLMVSTQQPYRLGKSWLFEGGVRVPFIVRWPENAKAGVTNDSVTVNTDIYPTILELAGLPLNPKQHPDGVSLAPTLKSGATMPFERAFHWVYDINHALGHRASIGIRRGDYKLIYWLKDGHTELYNVITDIGEDHDLSKEHPETVDTLLKELKQTEYVWRYAERKR